MTTNARIQADADEKSAQNAPKNKQNSKSDTPLLDLVNVPADMKGLDDEQIKQLADEVRSATITAVSQTGGHLGAGLGVVELTTAIHAVFDTPHDKLIFDVGHQCYPHKILTGRKARINTIRQGGGLSGFTKRSESEYDPFGAAHSSTSISAGLGMAEAAAQKGEPQKVVCVIGDGAMSAGMAYEAMNNAGALKSDLIVILNDNNMSISPPVGAMSRYLTGLVSTGAYRGARDVAKKTADFLPLPLKKAAARAEETARAALGGGTLFEEMGFYYIGPVDGHDMDQLLPILRNLKDNAQGGPVLIHAITQKGKGYAPAENAADKMHGVAKFDIVTGDQFKPKSSRPSYTKVFAQSLITEAKKDERIVAITAAMDTGTGLDLFSHEFPDRIYDVGIAEQHAVTFAGGLAAEGMKPFCAIYSTFLQRAYDQVIHDVALQNLPVRFAIDRAGLVGADGQTHAGSFDTTYLGCIPNMVLMAAGDEAELMHMVATAAAYDDGPIAFRYPRGEGIGLDLPDYGTPLEIGKGRIIHQTCHPERSEGSHHNKPDPSVASLHQDDISGDIAILSYGGRLEECKKATEQLEAKSKSVTLADARFAKPLDEDLIRTLCANHKTCITVEEGAIGGFGSFVLEFCNKENLLGTCRLHTMHLPDVFQDHNKPDKQYAAASLMADDIVKIAMKD